MQDFARVCRRDGLQIVRRRDKNRASESQVEAKSSEVEPKTYPEAIFFANFQQFWEALRFLRRVWKAKTAKEEPKSAPRGPEDRPGRPQSVHRSSPKAPCGGKMSSKSDAVSISFAKCKNLEILRNIGISNVDWKFSGNQWKC